MNRKNRTLGDTVAEARRASGLTLQALAERVLKDDGKPITPAYLHDILLGRRVPSDAVLESLAKALSLSPYLLYVLAGRIPPPVKDLPAEDVAAELEHLARLKRPPRS